MAERITDDHDEIKNWANSFGGFPVVADGEGETNEITNLKIYFPGELVSGRQISWEEFFDEFDDANLAFRYDTKSDPRSDKEFSFEFINRGVLEDADETVLPEENEMAEENMYSSNEPQADYETGDYEESREGEVKKEDLE
jgi:hypothetical protein